MATNNQIDRRDNSTLWTIITILVIAALAYAIYAASRDSSYQNTVPSGTVNSTTAPATTHNNQ